MRDITGESASCFVAAVDLGILLTINRAPARQETGTGRRGTEKL
jgi:hypothetical protein